MVQNKPTDEQTRYFCSKLEEYLSVWDPKITIELFDSPMLIKSWEQNQLEKKSYSWIEGVKIESPYFDGIETVIDDDNLEIKNNRMIWDQAWWLQNAIVRELGDKFIKEKEWQERYWKLWDHLKKVNEK